MLSRIFPRQFDNAWRGHPLALWLLIPLVLLKAVQGANSILNTRLVMTGADGIPIDRYEPAAAATAVTLFALLGLYTLILPLLSVAVLLRYRAMIPLIYLLLLFVQLGSRAILFLQPAGAPSAAHPIGFYINLGLLAALLIGFGLSLLKRPER